MTKPKTKLHKLQKIQHTNLVALFELHVNNPYVGSPLRFVHYNLHTYGNLKVIYTIRKY
jgi:hypothetical protein